MIQCVNRFFGVNWDRIKIRITIKIEIESAHQLNGTPDNLITHTGFDILTTHQVATREREGLNHD